MLLLEYNLYDNFNPNVMKFKKETNESGFTQLSGYDKPRARGVLLDFEVWQTGYDYTSSAVFPTEINVGDVVEVLTTENNALALSPTNTLDLRLSMWYVITTVDENNKATMQNYFWYMIQGNSYPTANIYGYAQTVWNIITNLSSPQVMHWDSVANWDEVNLDIKFNMKSDTVEMPELAKNLFAKIQLQPITFSYNQRQTKRPYLLQGLVTDEWTRQQKQTRIDIKQNPELEKVVITERSNYNYVNVFVKDATTEKYPQNGTEYTVDDDNKLVKMSTYTGDGTELPEQRIVKTMFYDEQPTDAQIKSEVVGDSLASKIYFNQNDLYPLQVNDLVKVWYQGTEYNGYIADRMFNSTGVDRLIFMEGKRGQ